MPIPHDRRAVLKKLAAATLAPAFSGLALADTYPSRPINLGKLCKTPQPPQPMR